MSQIPATRPGDALTSPARPAVPGGPQSAQSPETKGSIFGIIWRTALFTITPKSCTTINNKLADGIMRQTFAVVRDKAHLALNNWAGGYAGPLRSLASERNIGSILLAVTEEAGWDKIADFVGTSWSGKARDPHKTSWRHSVMDRVATILKSVNTRFLAENPSYKVMTESESIARPLVANVLMGIMEAQLDKDGKPFDATRITLDTLTQAFRQGMSKRPVSGGPEGDAGAAPTGRPGDSCGESWLSISLSGVTYIVSGIGNDISALGVLLQQMAASAGMELVPGKDLYEQALADLNPPDGAIAKALMGTAGGTAGAVIAEGLRTMLEDGSLSELLLTGYGPKADAALAALLDPKDGKLYKMLMEKLGPEGGGFFCHTLRAVVIGGQLPQLAHLLLSPERGGLAGYASVAPGLIFALLSGAASWGVAASVDGAHALVEQARVKAGSIFPSLLYIDEALALRMRKADKEVGLVAQSSPADFEPREKRPKTLQEEPTAYRVMEECCLVLKEAALAPESSAAKDRQTALAEGIAKLDAPPEKKEEMFDLVVQTSEKQLSPLPTHSSFVQEFSKPATDTAGVAHTLQVSADARAFILDAETLSEQGASVAREIVRVGEGKGISVSVPTTWYGANVYEADADFHHSWAQNKDSISINRQSVRSLTTLSRFNAYTEESYLYGALSDACAGNTAQMAALTRLLTPAAAEKLSGSVLRERVQDGLLKYADPKTGTDIELTLANRGEPAVSYNVIPMPNGKVMVSITALYPIESYRAPGESGWHTPLGDGKQTSAVSVTANVVLDADPVAVSSLSHTTASIFIANTVAATEMAPPSTKSP